MRSDARLPSVITAPTSFTAVVVQRAERERDRGGAEPFPLVATSRRDWGRCAPNPRRSPRRTAAGICPSFSRTRADAQGVAARRQRRSGLPRRLPLVVDCSPEGIPDHGRELLPVSDRGHLGSAPLTLAEPNDAPGARRLVAQVEAIVCLLGSGDLDSAGTERRGGAPGQGDNVRAGRERQAGIMPAAECCAVPHAVGGSTAGGSWLPFGDRSEPRRVHRPRLRRLAGARRVLGQHPWPQRHLCEPRHRRRQRRCVWLATLRVDNHKPPTRPTTETVSRPPPPRP